MKKLAVLLAALVLSACSLMQPLATGKVDPAMPPLQLEAQKLVNEANVLLAAVYQTAADNKTSGIWTDKQKNDCIAEADSYAAQVDSAKAFIKDGNYDAAKLKASATQVLVKALLRRAASANKGAATVDTLQPFMIGA